MKNRELISYKLTEGFEASEMQYKVVATRSKKTLRFLIVAIIVCAIAFSACFFALEISRVNKYNSHLNNSISSSQNSNNSNNNQIPPEDLPPETSGSKPDKPNIPSGSGSGEEVSDTGTIDTTVYGMLIQTVWGISRSGLAQSVNDLYNINVGIEEARKSTFRSNNISISIDGYGNNNYDDEYVALWEGVDPLTASPTYSADGEYNEGWGNCLSEESFRWSAIGITRACDEEFDIVLHVKNVNLSNYCLVFVEEMSDGSLQTLSSSVKISSDSQKFIYTFNAGTITSSSAFKKIYAVVTKAVSISVKDTYYYNYYCQPVIGFNMFGNPIYGDAVVLAYNLLVSNISVLNCIVGADGISTSIVAANDDVTLVWNGAWVGRDTTFATGAHYCDDVFYSKNWQKPTITYTNLRYYGLSRNASDVVPYLYDESVYNVCEFNFQKVLDYSKESINLQYSPAIINIGSSYYYCVETEHMRQALENIGSSGDATISGRLQNTNIDGDSDYFTYDGENKQKTIILNCKSGEATFKNLMVLTNNEYLNGSAVVVQDSYTVNVNKGTVYIAGTVQTVNNYSYVYIRDGANVSKINNHGAHSKIRFNGKTNSSTKTIINLNTISAYNQPLIITKGNHNFEVNILCRLNGDANNDGTSEANERYYVVASSNTGFDTPQTSDNSIANGKIMYSNGSITQIDEEEWSDETWKENKYITYIIIDPNKILITSYDGETNSFTWMIKCEQGNITGMPAGSLTATYILTSDIVITTLGFSGFSGFGATYPFKGTFDGNGYKITFEKNSGSSGLFKYLGDGAVVKNLILDGEITQPGVTDATANINFYYGLAFQTSGTVKFYNIYSKLKVKNPDDDVGPAVSLIYQNSGNLTFVNCVATEYPNNYTGTGTAHERSVFLGFNKNGAKVSFYNCASETYFYRYNTTNKNGIFVGWTNNSNTTSTINGLSYKAGVYFDACYVLDTTKYSDYVNTNYVNPVVGGVGTSDSPVEILGCPTGCKEDGKSLTDVTPYLNNFIDTWNNDGTKVPLYKWYNENYSTYMVIFDNISNEAELQSIANATDLSYRYAKLANDITLANWSAFKNIAGFLDGNNKTITLTGDCKYGIAKVNNGTIKNLTVSGTITTSAQIVGSVANENNGLILSCINNSTIDGYYYVGGIVGKNSGKISSCINNGKISGVSYVGGIVGYQYPSEISSQVIELCTNNGNIEYGGNYIGGIAGYASYIYNCSNTGNIICENSGSYIGGIAGKLERTSGNRGSVSVGRMASGTISAGSSKYVGGVVGYMSGDGAWVDVEGSNITIEITSEGNYIGGIIGYINNDVTDIATHCRNFVFSGKITASSGSYIGGIIGYFSNFIEQVTMSGVITTSNSCNYVGLIVGSGNVYSSLFTGCYENGNTVVMANGKTSGAYFTGRGSAGRCFAYSNETKILNTPLASDGTSKGITYTGCSTFKDINKSLVWNGIFFGYVTDAINTTTTNTNLYITDVDNLNAINNMIITNGVDYKFVEHFTFSSELGVLTNFEGLGSDAIPLKGGEFLGYITIENSVLFNYVSGTIIYGLQVYGESNKSYISKADSSYIHYTCNYANITIVESGAYIGGIVGNAAGCEFKRCENSGALTSTQTDTVVGGIVGKAENCTFDYCNNRANINSDGEVGGLIGIAEYCQIKRCINIGDFFEVNGIFGGIVGEILDSNVENCYVNCNITAASIGGIARYGKGRCTISNCITKGCYFSENGTVAGIIGYDSHYDWENSDGKIINCVSLAILKGQYVYGLFNDWGFSWADNVGVSAENSYFFGAIESSEEYNIIGESGKWFNTCGYNLNNITAETNNCLNAKLIYVKNNPVWSANKYINLLFETEITSLLNGTNGKLILDWNSNYTFNSSFWGSIYEIELEE